MTIADTGNAPQGTLRSVLFPWDASQNPLGANTTSQQGANNPSITLDDAAIPAGYERMQVYTPPGYDPSGATRYPVLYLMHGTGGDDKAWFCMTAPTGSVDECGFAANIYENLLVAKKTAPMIIVTPYIDDCGISLGLTADNIGSFGCTPKYLNSIIPFIDANFPTIESSHGRAMAGLSRGGFVTLTTCVPNLDTFAECYVYSAGFSTTDPFNNLIDYQNALGSVVADPARTNQMLDAPIYAATATGDQYFASTATQTTDMFTAAGVRAMFQTSDGGHQWANWRRYLWQTLQIMFTNTSGCSN
jgi:enterochelin esterase family protein